MDCFLLPPFLSSFFLWSVVWCGVPIYFHFLILHTHTQSFPLFVVFLHPLLKKKKKNSTLKFTPLENTQTQKQTHTTYSTNDVWPPNSNSPHRNTTTHHSTNVAQFMVGMQALGRQLAALGLAEPGAVEVRGFLGV
jgi:hypothetical protein